jgi:hypothetical protein
VTTTSPHQAGYRLPGRPPGPASGDSYLLSPEAVAGSSAKRCALLADLETQRRRLAALAEWLLEAGRRGESAVARNIVDGLERVAAHLAA